MHDNIEILPVDYLLKLGEMGEIYPIGACNSANDYKNQLDYGLYDSTVDVFIANQTYLLVNFPDDPSPLFPGFTNFQENMFLMTQPNHSVSAFWHFRGGDLIGLYYTDLTRVFIYRNLATIGASGGMGDWGYYTSNLTTRGNVNHHTV